MNTMDELVNRFLTWPVPADVHPDGTPGKPGRTGTNLLTAQQARDMLSHVLALHPLTTPVTREFCAAYPGTAAGIINALAQQSSGITGELTDADRADCGLLSELRGG